MVSRIGIFFILVGIACLLLFLYSDMVKAPQIMLLVAAVFLLGTGTLMLVTRPAPPPPPSSGRFRLLKKRGKQEKKDSRPH